ncbi:uncharacterized protein LOC135809715 [Sycon ciliatum]|uniref:uncharacterized protein LOC135809715 n=1 Tax=Sycon ciliatum TaxID=27933 RepID=UPI0031F60181
MAGYTNVLNFTIASGWYIAVVWLLHAVQYGVGTKSLNRHALRESYVYTLHGSGSYDMTPCVTRECLRALDLDVDISKDGDGRSMYSPPRTVQPDPENQGSQRVSLLAIHTIPAGYLRRMEGPRVLINLYIKGDVHFECTPSSSSIQVSVNHVGMATEMRNLHTTVVYSRDTNTLRITANQSAEVHSAVKCHSDITVSLPRRHHWPHDASITYHGGGESNDVNAVTVNQGPHQQPVLAHQERNRGMATCLKQSQLLVKGREQQHCPPGRCQHHCNGDLNTCECYRGFVKHGTQPGKCLRLLVFQLIVPELSHISAHPLYSSFNLESLLAIALAGKLQITLEQVHMLSIRQNTMVISIVEASMATIEYRLLKKKLRTLPGSSLVDLPDLHHIRAASSTQLYALGEQYLNNKQDNKRSPDDENASGSKLFSWDGLFSSSANGHTQKKQQDLQDTASHVAPQQPKEQLQQLKEHPQHQKEQPQNTTDVTAHSRQHVHEAGAGSTTEGAGNSPVSQETKPEMGALLVDALKDIIPSFNIDEIKIPGTSKLSDLALRVANVQKTPNQIKIVCQLPSRVESMIRISNLKLSNMTLTLDVLVQDGYAHKMMVYLNGTVMFASQGASFGAHINIGGTRKAELYLEAHAISLQSVLKAVLEKLSSKLSSTGLASVVVDFLSLQLTYDPSSPTYAIIHIRTASLKNIASKMFEHSGLSKLKFLNLKSLLGSFDILNVSATIILQKGTVSFSLGGLPSIPTLGLESEMSLAFLRIGGGNQSFRSQQITFPTCNLMTILSTFVPHLSALKSMPGLGSIRVPKLSVSFSTGHLPSNITLFKSLWHSTGKNSKGGNFSLAHFMPPKPGFSFITRLMPKSGRGITLNGTLSSWRLSVGKMRLPNVTEGVLSVQNFITSFFPKFDLKSLRLPPGLANIQRAIVDVFKFDVKKKLLQLRMNFGKINLLKGVMQNSKLIACNSTIVSLNTSYSSSNCNTTGFQASCLGKFFGFPGLTLISRHPNGFLFSTELSRISLPSILGLVNSQTSSFGSFLRSLGLSKVSLQNTVFQIVTGPLGMRFSGTLRFGDLRNLMAHVHILNPFKRTSRLFSMELLVANSSLSAVVKSFFKIDISSIPFFGKLSLPNANLLVLFRTQSSPIPKFLDHNLVRIVQLNPSKMKSVLVKFPVNFGKLGTLNLSSAISKMDVYFKMPNVSVSAYNLLNVILPGSVQMAKLPPFLGGLKQLYIEQFSVKWKPRELRLHATYDKDITISKGIFKMAKVSVHLSFAASHFDFSLAASAQILDSMVMTANVTKKGKLFSAELSTVEPVRIMDMFAHRPSMQSSTKDMRVDQVVLYNLTGAVKFTSHFKLNHIYLFGNTTLGHAQASGSLLLAKKEISEHSNSTVQQNRASAWETLFSFCAHNVSLPALVKNLTKHDISSIPILGAMSFSRIGVVMATGNVSVTKLIRGCRGMTLPDRISSGVWFEIVLDRSLQSGTLSLSVAGSTVAVNVRNVTLLAIVKLIFPSFKPSSIKIPKGFPQLSEMMVSEMDFDSASKTARVRVNIGSFHLPKQILSCHHTVINLNVNYSIRPYNFSFEAKCTGKLLSQDIEVVFGLAEESPHFKTTIKKMSVRAMLSHGHLADSDFKKVLESVGLLDLTLLNVTLEMKTKHNLMSMSGTLQFGDRPGEKAELLVLNPFNSATRKTILGVTMPKINLSKLIAQLFHKAGISSFPEIGNINLDETRLLTMSQPDIRTKGLTFLDGKLNKLLGLVSTHKDVAESETPESFSWKRWKKTKSDRKLFRRSLNENMNAVKRSPPGNSTRSRPQTSLLPHVSALVSMKFSTENTQDMLLSLSSKIIDFIPSPNTVSLANVLRIFVSSENLKALGLPDFLPKLESLFINSVYINVPEKIYKVDATLKGPITVVKSFLVLNNFNFGFYYQNKTLSFNFTANAQILGKTFKAEFSRIRGRYRLLASTPSIHVSSTLGKFGSLEKQYRHLGVSDFTIEQASLEVRWGNGANLISVYGLPTLSGYQHAKVQMTIFNFTTLKEMNFFIGIEIPLGKISTLIKRVTSIDIGKVPTIGKAEVRGIGLFLSSTVIELNHGFHFQRSGFEHLKNVPKGIRLYFYQSVDVKNISIVVDVGLKSLTFRLPDGFSLHDAIAYLSPATLNDKTYKAFGKVYGWLFKMQVKAFTYDSDAQVTSILGRFPQSFKLFKGKFVMTSASYNASFLGAHNFSYMVTGQMKLFNKPFNASIGYNSRKGALIFQLSSSKDFKLSDIGSFKVNSHNKFIRNLHLDKIGVQKPKVQIMRMRDGFGFRISGKPTLPLFGTFAFEVITVPNPMRYLITFSKQHTSVTKIIKDLTSFDLSKVFFLHFLSGPASIGVSYTNIKRGEKLPFKVNSYPLHDVKVIPEGLSLTFEYKLPKCGSDLLCKFIHAIIGDKEVEFELENIGHEPEFKIQAPIAQEIKLGGLKIYDVRVGAMISEGPPMFGLTHAEMDINIGKGEKLHFEGDLEIDAAMDAELDFKMVGMWRKAFGLPFLAIGNIVAGARININCPECVTKLELGGEIWLGYKCNINDNKTKCIMGRGYFGIDEERPDDNYFFFSINQFSMSKVLIALGAKPSPILKILDVWSVKDILFSYSVLERDVPHGNTTQHVPGGLVMKGKITLYWFLSVHIDLRITAFHGVPTGMVGKIWADPVKIGKVLRLTSAEDDKKGPFISAKFGVIPLGFGAKISAKLSIPIFKITVKVSGSISLKGIEFNFSANILFFKVNVELSAGFKDNKHPGKLSGFRFKGVFDLSSLNDFLAKVKHVISVCKKKADAAFKKALAAVDAASKKLQGFIANKKLAAKVKEKRNAAFNKAKQGVRKAQQTIEHLCSVKKCAKWCGIPKPCFKKHCGCLHYPCGWLKFCCKKICVPLPGFCGKMCVPKNPACLLKAAACLPLRLAAFAAKKVAIGVLNVAQKALNVAQKIYMAAATAFAKYNPVFLIAKGILHLAKLAVDGIANIIIHFPLQINKIWFDLQLGTANGSFLEVGSEIVFSGKKRTLNFRINLKNIWATIWSLAKSLFKSVFGWLRKLKIKI